MLSAAIKGAISTQVRICTPHESEIWDCTRGTENAESYPLARDPVMIRVAAQ